MKVNTLPIPITDRLRDAGKEAELLALLDAGVLPYESAVHELEDASGYTLLHWASFHGWICLLERLLRNISADHLNSRSNATQETPLHRCARMGHVSVAYRILKTDKVVRNLLDYEVMTPFQRACQCGRCELVLFLFYYDRPSIASPEELWRAMPLIIACAYPMSDQRMHEMLIRLNVDPCAIQESNRMTAPHYLAANRLYRYLATWIQRHPIDLESRNAAGKSILELVESKSARRYLERLYWSRKNPRNNLLRLNMIGIAMWVLPLMCICLTEMYSSSLIGCLIAFGIAYHHFGGYRAELEEIQELIYSVISSYSLVFVVIAFISQPIDCSIVYIMVSQLTYVITIYSLIRLRWVLPDFIYSLNADQEQDIVLDLASQDRLTPRHYCTTCGCVRLPNSRHCRICNKCVVEMDHHCLAIARCVGKGNYRLFLTFLLSAVLSGCFGIRDIYSWSYIKEVPILKAYCLVALWMAFATLLALIVMMISWLVLRRPLYKWSLATINDSHPSQSQGTKSNEKT